MYQELSKHGHNCYCSWYVAISAIVDPFLLSMNVSGFGSFSEHGQIVKEVCKSLL